MLESNPSDYMMAGQYLGRAASNETLQLPNHRKQVLACPKAINSPEQEAARSASE